MRVFFGRALRKLERSMIRYAQLTPGPGWQPLRALRYYSYRLASATPLGRTLANGIAAILAIRHPVRAAETDKAQLDNLVRHGFTTLPPLLSDKQIDEMLAYLAGREPIRRKALAGYPLSDVVNCPQMMELANHPRLLSLAARYLGCAPTISTIGLRWSFPAEQVAGVQAFHRDPDDWKTLKFFTYLTDVEEGAGPHVYIAGSHRDIQPVTARRYSDAEVAQKYGRDAQITVMGPRGAMFMADTAGIHKGAAVVTGSRLLLEVGYTLLPIYAMDYSPVALARNRLSLDRYINRLIVKPQPASEPGLKAA
jgi:hypothetical protein